MIPLMKGQTMDERDNNITNSISEPDEDNIRNHSEPSDKSSVIHPRQEDIDQPVYTSMPEGTAYDRFMYEPIGFENEQKQENPFAAMPMKKKAGKGEAAAVILFVIVLLACFGFAVYGIFFEIRSGGRALEELISRKPVVLYRDSSPVRSDDELLKPDKDGNYSVEGVSMLVKPSIVEIFTYTSQADFKVGNAAGSGSGIVISKDGYIVTNAHVLHADGIHTVSTVDGKTYDAKVIGRDVKTDIAVIKINEVDMTPAVFGNSDNAVVGQPVIAIGNPVSLSFTVTDGIVSAVHRKIRTDETTFEMECIQTNADISPGNSGGALINMRGEVIGITSSKYVNSSYEGLGFAISSNEALPIIDELIDHGYVKGRFRIGIHLVDMADQSKIKVIEDTIGFKLPEGFTGIYIGGIDEDSDVINTDLKVGDFITKINGVKVRTYTEFYNAITSSYGAGDKVPATCAHIDADGKITTYEIKFKLLEDTSGNY